MRKKFVLPVIGWREWVALPALGIDRIKAKIDTGARTSSIHAANIRYVERGGDTFVQFKVYPLQRDTSISVECESKLVGERSIKSSSGHSQIRPVIRTEVELQGMNWEIELSLTPRWDMGFRMLLGRQAIRRRFLVSPGHSFLSES